MGNKKAGMTISIFSIIYAAINFVTNLNGEFIGIIEPNYFGAAISLGLLVVGVISVIKLKREETIKAYVIVMLVFWFLLIIASMMFLLIPELGVYMFVVGIGISIAPIITGFKYLSSLKITTKNSFENNSNVGDVVDNLERIIKMLNNGEITQEEYDKLREKILEND